MPFPRLSALMSGNPTWGRHPQKLVAGTRLDLYSRQDTSHELGPDW